MTADHRIEWESDEKETAQALAATMIAIFPVGVPLGLFILLFVKRGQIMLRQTRCGDIELDYIGELIGLELELGVHSLAPTCWSTFTITKAALSFSAL